MRSQSKNRRRVKNKYSCITHTLLDVLEEEGRRPKVVHGAVEEALNLLLVQVHRDYVVQARPAHHLGHQLRHDAAALAHFACPFPMAIVVRVAVIRVTVVRDKQCQPKAKDRGPRERKTGERKQTKQRDQAVTTRCNHVHQSGHQTIDQLSTTRIAHTSRGSKDSKGRILQTNPRIRVQC